MFALRRVVLLGCRPLCTKQYKLLMCLFWYPVCGPDDRPRRPCLSSCDNLMTLCKGAYDVAGQTGFETQVMLCDDTVGGSKSETSQLNVDYFAEWKGKAAFQEDVYTDPHFGADMQCTSEKGLDQSAMCKSAVCQQPMIEARQPVAFESGPRVYELQNPEDMEFCTAKNGDGSYVNPLNCSRCTSVCELQCPYSESTARFNLTSLTNASNALPDDTVIFFTSGEQLAMWLAVWLPGWVGLPLNVLIMLSEVAKLKRMKKKDATDYLILFAGLIGVLLWALDAAPSLVQGSGMRCSGWDTFSDFKNLNGSPVCRVGKLRVFVLQALSWCVVANLYKVYRQLSASRKMSKYSPGPGARYGLPALVWLVPSAFAAVALATEANPRVHAGTVYRNYFSDVTYNDPDRLANMTSLFHPNNLRNMYSCGVFFDTVEIEIALVSVPMLASGFIACVLSILLLMSVSAMHTSSGGKNDTTRRLAINMLRFAAISIALTVFNFATTFIFMPAAAEFGKDLSRWVNCLSTGMNQDNIVDAGGAKEGLVNLVNKDKSLFGAFKTCNSIRNFAPDPALLISMSLAQSLPPMLFGFVFAIPAMKQLSAAVTARFSVVPTSSMNVSRSRSGSLVVPTSSMKVSRSGSLKG